MIPVHIYDVIFCLHASLIEDSAGGVGDGRHFALLLLTLDLVRFEIVAWKGVLSCRVYCVDMRTCRLMLYCGSSYMNLWAESSSWLIRRREYNVMAITEPPVMVRSKSKRSG